MVNFHLPSLDRLKDHTLSVELPWALPALISSKPYLHKQMSFGSQIHTAGIGKLQYSGSLAAETAVFSLSREKVGRECTKRNPYVAI